MLHHHTITAFPAIHAVTVRGAGRPCACHSLGLSSCVALYCRPFVFQREPHLAFAMAIYDASLNLTEDSPNSYKQRTEVTGIARMNIRSKQVCVPASASTCCRLVAQAGILASDLLQPLRVQADTPARLVKVACKAKQPACLAPVNSMWTAHTLQHCSEKPLGLRWKEGASCRMPVIPVIQASPLM